MEEYLNDSVQILLVILVSAKVLENKKCNLRGFGKASGPARLSSLAKSLEGLDLFDLRGFV